MKRAPWALTLTAALAACDFGGRPALDPALAADLAAAEARVAQNPDDGEALIQLGQIYAKAARWFDAADRFKQALDRGQHDQRAYVGLSEAYVKLAYWGPAYQTLSRCNQLPGQNEECLLRLGVLLRQDGSKEGLREAKQILGRFLVQAPEHPRANEVRTVMRQIEVQLGKDAEGPVAAEEAPPPASAHGASPHGASPHGAAPHAAAPPGGAGAPDIPEHQNIDGQEVGELNEFGAAIGKALEAIKRQDAPAAEKALLEALKISPTDVGAHALLSETYLALNDTPKAVASAEKALQLDAKDPQAQWIYGLVMIRTGKDMKRGVEVWEQLARDQPEAAKQLGVTQTLEQVRSMNKPHPK